MWMALLPSIRFPIEEEKNAKKARKGIREKSMNQQQKQE
jgi:hypothetical protein